MNLTEKDISVLYQSGGISKNTVCVAEGKQSWQTIDEMFPLLKYEGHSATRYSDYPTITTLSWTSAMTAGWICFGIGAAVSWFFPPGYVFFSTALVMSVVAMATHQVSRGLILFLSSFLAMGVSMVISFILAIGLFAAAASSVITKVDEESKKRNTVTNQQLNTFHQAAQNVMQSIPSPATQITPQDDLTRQINQMNHAIQEAGPKFPLRPTAKTQDAIAARPISIKPAIDTSVDAQLHRIEEQKRARESYKEQHARLHSSLDYWEEKARNSGKGTREFAEKQIDALRKQIQELNNKNLGL